MTDKLLELIQLCIQSGDDDDARNLLSGVLRADPKNLQAWEFMAMLQRDPEKRADCYRQILNINPDHQEARDGLDALSGERAHIPPPEVQQVVNLLRTLGVAALDSESIGHFKDLGVDISIVDEYITISSGSKEVKMHTSSLPNSRSALYPDEVVRSAGKPLTPSESMECPNCKAIIPRWSTRCSWCDADLK
jgi:hypothetical protein